MVEFGDSGIDKILDSGFVCYVGLLSEEFVVIGFGLFFFDSCDLLRVDVVYGNIGIVGEESIGDCFFEIVSGIGDEDCFGYFVGWGWG